MAQVPAQEENMNVEAMPGKKTTNADADRWLEKLDPFERAAFEFSVTEDEKERAERIAASKIQAQTKPEGANSAKFAEDAEKTLETKVGENLPHPVSKRQLGPSGGPQMDLEPELGTS